MGNNGSNTVVNQAVEKIPQLLRTKFPRNWVNWRWASTDQNVKLPLNPETMEPAKANDPETWGTLEQACSTGHAIGFMFPVGPSGLVGVDLDKCLIRDAGELKLAEWAENIVKLPGCYWEVSPSGTGLKGWVWAPRIEPDFFERWGHKRHVRELLQLLRKSETVVQSIPEAAKIEIYAAKRFFTVTGKTFSTNGGAPPDLEDRSDEVRQLIEKLMKPKDPEPQDTPENHESLTEQQLEKTMDLLNRMCLSDEKLKMLWMLGDTSEHNDDHSTADMALLVKLAFYTGNNPLLMEEMFNQSPLADRNKWKDRRDYRERSIKQAIKLNSSNVYTPPSAGEQLFTTLEDCEDPFFKAPEPEPRLWNMEDLATGDFSPVEWAVHNLVQKNGLGFMAGLPKDGKSLLFLDMMICHMNGQKWLDRFEIDSNLRVLLIAREDPERRLKHRINCLQRGHGFPVHGPRNEAVFPNPDRVQILPYQLYQLTGDKANYWFDWTAKQVEKHRINMLVLDVVNRMLPGIEGLTDYAPVIQQLERFQKELGLTVWPFDHIRKPGQGSGRNDSSPNPLNLYGDIRKYGACDFTLMVARKEGGFLHLSSETKDTDGEFQFMVHLAGENLNDQIHGKTFVKWAGEFEKVAKGMQARSQDNRIRILSVLREARQRGKDLSAAEIAQFLGCDVDTVTNHIKQIHNVIKVGSGKKTRYRLGPEFENQPESTSEKENADSFDSPNASPKSKNLNFGEEEPFKCLDEK